MKGTVTLTERDQLRVRTLDRVEAGALTTGEAAEQLGVSARQVRRLLVAYRAEGMTAIPYGNRGRPPAHTVAAAVRARVLELSRTTYAGSNGSHLRDLLEEREGIALSLSTVRRIRREAGEASPRQRRPPAHRQRLFERPEMTRLRQAMRGRAFDVLIVRRLDRLSRDLNHCGYVLSEAEHHGVGWASVTEPYLDDSPMGTILRAVISAFGQMDRIKIAANTKRGREEKLAAGKPIATNAAPFGMRWNADKTRLEPDPRTAPIVARLFASAASGASIRGMCRELEEDGVLPPYHGRAGRASTRWNPSTLRHILHSRVYLGEGRWNQTVKVKTKNGKKAHKARDAAEHVRLPDGVYPALVDAATFARAHERLAGNQRESPAFRETRNPDVGLLRRGLARCGVCGASLVIGRNNSGTVYRCQSDRKERGQCAGGGVIPVDELDVAAWDYVATVLTNPARIQRHVETLRRDDPTAHDLAGLDRHRRDLEAQWASLTAAIVALADNPHATTELVARLDVVGKQHAANERDREAVLARQAAWQSELAQLDDLAARCREVEEAVALATEYADRRALLTTLRVSAALFPTNRQERWAITSGVVADVATNLSNTESGTGRGGCARRGPARAGARGTRAR